MDILAVDDEEAIRTSSVIALETDDHHAESVSSGEQGLLRLKEEEIEADAPPPPTSVTGPESDVDPSALMPGGSATIKELETEHIRRVLARTKTLQEAAGILGIDQATLYRKRKKIGL